MSQYIDQQKTDQLESLLAPGSQADSRYNQDEAEENGKGNASHVVDDEGDLGGSKQFDTSTNDAKESVKNDADVGHEDDSSFLKPERKNKKICGMVLKRDVSKFTAVFGVPGFYFTQCCAAVFVNAQVVFLLRDPEYFSVEGEMLGRMTNRSLLAQLIVQTLVAVVIGYVYDLVGRKKTIGISFVIMCISLMWIPYSAPSFLSLCGARMLLGIAIQIQLNNPMVNDYIKKESRGKATIFQNFGYILGETFSMALLFNFTKTMPIEKSFLIATVTMAVLGVFMTAVITEHKSSKLLNRQKKQQQLQSQEEVEGQPEYASASVNADLQLVEAAEVPAANQISQQEKARAINARVYETIMNEPGYALALFGAFQIRLISVLMVVNLLLWVTSFVDSGYLAEEDDAKKLYQNLLLSAVGSAVVMGPVMLYLVDLCNLGWVIGTSFFMRGCCFVLGFPLLQKPDSALTYFIAMAMMCSSGCANVSVEAFYYKMTPSDIAGTMRGLFNLSGQMGVLCLILTSGYMYDKWGASSPFFVVGCLDLLCAILAFVLTALGKIKSNGK